MKSHLREWRVNVLEKCNTTARNIRAHLRLVVMNLSETGQCGCVRFAGWGLAKFGQSFC